MVKQVLEKPGQTFQEFTLLPGLTPRTGKISSISLESHLGNVTLKIPFLSAAMMSVTGYQLALSLSKEGGLPVLPARMPLDEQLKIISAIKSTEMTFVQDPVTIRETESIDSALQLVSKYGHASIPVVDRNNVFMGMFLHHQYLESGLSPKKNVQSAMISREQTPTCVCPEMAVADAKSFFKENTEKYLVVLDDQNRLVKLAFRKDDEQLKVGTAITTHAGWKERVIEHARAGINLFVIDTSDGFSDFQADVLDDYKNLSLAIPICAGNVVTYEGAMFLMEHGADIIKVGMSPGSTCTTHREKAVGRAPMTALLEVDRARKDYSQKTGRYIPIIADGGITGSGDMVIALTVADALMMGGYFNKFFEAAGEKFDVNKSPTTIEDQMAYVASWGEGSLRARNLDRYEHAGFATFFPEGAEGLVAYKGRLKPDVKTTCLKIKSAMSNAGVMNLSELRENAVLEPDSAYAGQIVNTPHGLVQ